VACSTAGSGGAGVGERDTSATEGRGPTVEGAAATAAPAVASAREADSAAGGEGATAGEGGVTTHLPDALSGPPALAQEAERWAAVLRHARCTAERQQRGSGTLVGRLRPGEPLGREGHAYCWRSQATTGAQGWGKFTTDRRRVMLSFGLTKQSSHEELCNEAAGTNTLTSPPPT